MCLDLLVRPHDQPDGPPHGPESLLPPLLCNAMVPSNGRIREGRRCLLAFAPSKKWEVLSKKRRRYDDHDNDGDDNNGNDKHEDADDNDDYGNDNDGDDDLNHPFEEERCSSGCSNRIINMWRILNRHLPRVKSQPPLHRYLADFRCPQQTHRH